MLKRRTKGAGWLGAKTKVMPLWLGYHKQIAGGVIFGFWGPIWLGETWIKGVGVLDKLQEGGLGMVVLTFCPPIPILSPICFPTPYYLYPPISTHLVYQVAGNWPCALVSSCG